MISLDHRSDTNSSIRDPMGSKIQSQKYRGIGDTYNGIQDLLSNLAMGSDCIMDPILHLVERSSGIIDSTLGSTDTSAPKPTYPQNLVSPRISATLFRKCWKMQNLQMYQEKKTMKYHNFWGDVSR